MNQNSAQEPSEKQGLHPRNQHRHRYNFNQLIHDCSELAPYVSINQYGDESIDFANPNAVKMLNKALLKHFYGIANWDIPKNYLCPPIPSRADYIHYAADLLASCNNGIIPTGKSILTLDIGIGANCVYPIIGHQTYGWRFVGSDIDPIAIRSAKNIVAANNALVGAIDCRQQMSANQIFRDIIKPGELFDLSICNPPFHSSAEEANAGTQRKWKNLGNQKNAKPVLNFGGQNAELWCEGGERVFVRRMIEESSQLPNQCFWFTTLVSKKTNLPTIYEALKKVKALEVRTINMTQGQKTSRIVAWTFFDESKQKERRMKRWVR